MDAEKYHLLRTRLDSMLQGQELTVAQAEALENLIKVRVATAPVTVFSPLGPTIFDVPPEPAKAPRAKRRGRGPDKKPRKKGGRRVR